LTPRSEGGRDGGRGKGGGRERRGADEGKIIGHVPEREGEGRGGKEKKERAWNSARAGDFGSLSYRGEGKEGGKGEGRRGGKRGGQHSNHQVSGQILSSEDRRKGGERKEGRKEKGEKRRGGANAERHEYSLGEKKKGKKGERGGIPALNLLFSIKRGGEKGGGRGGGSRPISFTEHTMKGGGQKKKKGPSLDLYIPS